MAYLKCAEMHAEFRDQEASVDPASREALNFKEFVPDLMAAITSIN